jgi:plastocyanin
MNPQMNSQTQFSNKPIPSLRVLLSLAAVSLTALVLPAGAASLTVQVADAAAKALPDAIVYVVPKTGNKTAAADKASVVIDQIDRQFVPLVSVVQTGTAVTFPNKDNIRHNVYSFSPPKTFELRLYSGVPAKPVVFDKPGLVVLGCNIHDQMIAYVQVVDTPWFAKTDAAGNVRIENLPPGNYEVRAWHYRLLDPNGEFSRSVKLDADSTLQARLTLKP